MSLIKLPIRISSVKALEASTLAGANVFDSAITPLETQASETGQALIAVYTDDTHANTSAFNARDLMGYRPRCSLTLHLAIAKKGFSTTTANRGIVIAPSDKGFETILDILEAQIFRVLQTSPSPWANLFRALALRFDDIHIRRGASSRKGLRFAAREIVLPIEGHPDPLGTGNEYPWNAVIDAFKCDPDLDDLAALLEDFCTADQMQPSWKKALNTTGLDRATASALGFVTEDGEALLWL